MEGWSVVGDQGLRIAQEAAGAGYAAEFYSGPLEADHNSAKAYDELWDRALKFLQCFDAQRGPFLAQVAAALATGQDSAFVAMVDRHLATQAELSAEIVADVVAEERTVTD
jgi:hypothetical protein